MPLLTLMTLLTEHSDLFDIFLHHKLKESQAPKYDQIVDWFGQHDYILGA